MTTTTSAKSDLAWRSSPYVRKAIAFVKKRGSVTADELVAWDRSHGRKLFNWDDASAADDHRRYQARHFLNHFRAKFDGMRVRAFIHVDEDADAGIEKSAYVTVETISNHEGMRAQVIADITKRMASLASELRMWKLSSSEREKLFDRLRTAIETAPAVDSHENESIEFQNEVSRH